MNTAKLRDALEEMKAHRGVIDGAISHLESALSLLEAAPLETAINGATTFGGGPRLAFPANTHGARTYIDDSEFLIQNAGHPLHARDLAEGISKLRNKEIARASVESTLIRHISDLGNRARIIKTGASTYGVPSIAHSQPALAELNTPEGLSA